MIKVKSFTTQLKIFHTRHELDELDKEVSDFIASRGIRKVISISDSSTSGNSGETIGLIRVLAYEEPAAGSREHYLEQIESTLNEWGEEIESIRKKADKLGAGARGKYREQLDDLFPALLEIGERRNAEISQQLPIAGTKPLLHRHRRVMIEHLLTPGIGGNHPEDGFSMVALLDQLPTAVDRDRASNAADICCERKGRLDGHRGGVEQIG